jgi:Fe-S cluster assembly protein SufB
MRDDVRDMLADENYKKQYGFSTNAEYVEFQKGISEAVVRKISALKGEPEWMLKRRLLAYKVFTEKPVPDWGADLSGINFDDIHYYKMPKAKEATKWEDVPKEIKETFEKLGVPEAERKFFAGEEAQFDSGVIYSSVKKRLEDIGVIFTDMDTALKKYPEIVKKYFGTVVPLTDNKFASLNTATWSGGSFVFVPKGVKVPMPLNAYFRMNSERMGQFERTLIIAEEGSDITYVEGCTAPIYSSNSLHAAVVEVIVQKNAHVRYITIQNWAKNVYNVTTQRAFVEENAHMEWVDANLGSKTNMKYPCLYLRGRNAKGEILSIALASEGQSQDSGGKAYHLAPDTTSRMVSKSISKGTGIATFRGIVYIGKEAENSKASTSCNALLLDSDAKTNTYPYVDVQRNDAMVSHEAKVGKISEDDVFYLMSRGIPESDAVAMIILGFLKDLGDVLPMEYSLELKRLIKLNMAGSVG